MSDILEEYASVLYAMRHRSVRSVEDYIGEYRRRFELAPTAGNADGTALRSGDHAHTEGASSQATVQPIRELKLRDDILAAISIERRNRKRAAEATGALCTFQPELSPKAQHHQHANKVWHERLHTDDVMKRELHAAERTHQRTLERQQAEEEEVREMSRGPAAHASANTFNRLYMSGRQHDKWVEREQQLQADLLARELQKGQRSPYRNGSSERPTRRPGNVFDNLYNEARQRQGQQHHGGGSQSEHDVATRHVDTPNRSVDLRRKNTVSPSRMAENSIHQRLYDEATDRQQSLTQAQEEQRAKSLEGLFQPNLARKESAVRSHSFRREVVEVAPSHQPAAAAASPKLQLVGREEAVAALPKPSQQHARDPSPTNVSPPRERQTLSPVVISSVATLEVKSPLNNYRSTSASQDRELSSTRTPATLPAVTSPAPSAPPPHELSEQALRPVPMLRSPSVLTTDVAAAPASGMIYEVDAPVAPSIITLKESKPKKLRTPDEQIAHDQRKKERHDRKETERRLAEAALTPLPVAKAKTPPQRNLTPPPHANGKKTTSPSLNAGGGARTPPPQVEKEDVFGAEEPIRGQELFIRQSIDLGNIAKLSAAAGPPNIPSDTSAATPEEQSPATSALETNSSAGRTAESPSRVALALDRKRSRRMILENITVLDSDADSSS